VKNVPSATYHVIVGSNSETLRDYFTKSMSLGGKDVADSGFTVSGATYSLDVLLSAHGGAIEGTVLDSENQAVAYATVVCVPSAEHRKRPDVYQQDISDQQGHFSLRGLNPGEYTVLAWETWKTTTAIRNSSNRLKVAARLFDSTKANAEVSR
jgi:hypothetical protein